MRKKVWSCAVAAAFTALGGTLAVDYACSHPDSWLGRCVFAAHSAAVTEVRTLHATQCTAEFAVQGLHGLLAHGKGTVCEDGNKCPDHPGGSVEQECPAPPAVLPGVVAMHVEGGGLAEKPMPPVCDGGAAEECEEFVMPRAEDDAPKMPRAEQGDDDCCRPTPKSKAKQPGSGGEMWEAILQKLQGDGGEKPRHPEVDTMEVRPSDLWFLDLTGPF